MREGLLGSLEGPRFRQETARKGGKEGEEIPMRNPALEIGRPSGGLPALKLSFTRETRGLSALSSAED